MDVLVNTVLLLASDGDGVNGLTDVISASCEESGRGIREGDLGAIWDEGFLRSWPGESLDIVVNEIVNILVDAVLLFASDGDGVNGFTDVLSASVVSLFTSKKFRWRLRRSMKDWDSFRSISCRLIDVIVNIVIIN